MTFVKGKVSVGGSTPFVPYRPGIRFSNRVIIATETLDQFSLNFYPPSKYVEIQIQKLSAPRVCSVICNKNQ